MRLLTLALFLVLAATLGAASQDDRAADREAIRAHIDRIFQAFIKKDAAELRATHAPKMRFMPQSWATVAPQSAGDGAIMLIVKTDLGHQVMKDRSVPLTPRQRSAFILFDGKRTLDHL